MNSFQMEGSFQEKSSTNSRQSEQVKNRKRKEPPTEDMRSLDTLSPPG